MYIRVGFCFVFDSLAMVPQWDTDAGCVYLLIVALFAYPLIELVPDRFQLNSISIPFRQPGLIPRMCYPDFGCG